MKWIALFVALVMVSGCVFTTPWGNFGISGTGETPPSGGTGAGAGTGTGTGGTGGEVSGGTEISGETGGEPGGEGAEVTGGETGAGEEPGTEGTEVSGGETGAPGGEVSPGEEPGAEIGTPPEESNLVGPFYEPTVVYFDPGAGGFMVEMDGIVNSIYDKVGVVLRTGETADPKDPNSLFVGDYPAHSPRDLVITSRVMMGNRELEEWRAATAGGDLQRKYLSVVLLDSERREIGRINYGRAWPSAYSLDVNSGTFEETLVLSSETVERVE